MKKYVYLCLALITIGALFFSFVKDDEQLTSFLEKFERFTAEHPQEKVHLHLDKPFYSIGDEIWFKAYLVNAEENKLSILSKVLYVDLIDDQDSIRKTFVLPLENGLASGNIMLADSLYHAGSYQLRAYTNWMRNSDDAYFFQKTIEVGDALSGSLTAKAKFDISTKGEQVDLRAAVTYKDFRSAPQSDKEVSYRFTYKDAVVSTGTGRTDQTGMLKINQSLKKSIPVNQLILTTTITKNDANRISNSFRINVVPSAIDVQFFPEGGDLIHGIRSKVAFKAVGRNGLAAEVEGAVVDQDGNRVADIQVTHAGMGLFALTPKAGKTYSALVNTKNGPALTFSLPKSLSQGYVLSLNHLEDESILLRVDCSSALRQDKELILIGQSNGITKYVSKIKLDRTLYTSKIAEDILGEGIVQFTLFTADYSPVAERLIFIHPKKLLTTDITSSKPFYAKREKVDLNIQVNDFKKQGVVGSFSVSVVNQDKVAVAEEDQTTIVSNLLLTSDLRGYVERPNYYFVNVDLQKIKALDLLMLTQGWRRFDWQNVTNGKKLDIKFKAEQGLTISGTITSLSNKPIPFGKVNLFVPSMAALIDTVADANGRFVFDELSFPDSTRLIVRAKSAKDRNNVKIVIDVNPPIPFKRTVVANQTEETAFVNYLRHSESMYNELDKYGLVSKGIALKEVVIKQRHPHIPNSVFPQLLQPDHTITPKDLQSSGEIAHMLTGLSGVYIKNNRIYGIGYDEKLGRRREGPMLVLLNGMPFDDLSGIAPNSLAGVQIIKGGLESTMAGSLLQSNPRAGEAKYGIVFLTTERRATKYNTFIPSGLNLLKPNGYTFPKQFYNPTYPIEDKLSKMQDLRSTIFWQPNLITDDSGNARFSFYTADEPGRYLVTLEGVSINGNLARKNFTFTIK